VIRSALKKSSLALGFVLAACATPTAETPAPVIVAVPMVQQPVQQEPETLPAASEPLVVDMARIENQTPTNVIEYLGTPSLVRRDDTVQVMIFETGTCVVEVIFFEPENGDHFRAHRVNARSTSGQDVDTENCVRRQLEQNQ